MSPQTGPWMCLTLNFSTSTRFSGDKVVWKKRGLPYIGLVSLQSEKSLVLTISSTCFGSRIMVSALTPCVSRAVLGKTCFQDPGKCFSPSISIWCLLHVLVINSLYSLSESISKDAYDHHSEYSHHHHQQQQPPQPQSIPINTVFYPIFITKTTPVFFPHVFLFKSTLSNRSLRSKKMHPRIIFTAILRPWTLKQNHALDVHCPWHFKPCIPKKAEVARCCGNRNYWNMVMLFQKCMGWEGQCMAYYWSYELSWNFINMNVNIRIHVQSTWTYQVIGTYPPGN